MKCDVCDKIIIGNKKSFSNHCRWCKGVMSVKSYLGINKGNKNCNWKDVSISYSAIHEWIRRNKKKPTECQECGIKTNNLDAHNISGKYLRNTYDYIYLCRGCHAELHKKLRREYATMSI